MPRWLQGKNLPTGISMCFVQGGGGGGGEDTGQFLSCTTNFFENQLFLQSVNTIT